MRKYFNTVVSTTTGKPLPNASVRVKDSAGDLASLYSDTSSTVLANPVTTDANGFYEFYIDDGVYTLEFLYGGELLQTIRDVDISEEGLPAHVTRALLAAASTLNPSATLIEPGREGLFTWDDSDLSTEVAYDTEQGVYVAPSSDTTGASGAWVRKTRTLTPHMFGAVGDGVTDDTDALQAFYDFSFYTANAEAFTFNHHGEWLISGPLYIQQEADGVMPAGTSQVRRHFNGVLNLVVDVIANLPGGVPITDVLTITGAQQVWDGQVRIRDTAFALGAFTTRVFYNGVRCYLTSDSRLPHFHVEGALRHGVVMDSESLAPPTLRSGTAYEQTLDSRNNIGTTLHSVSGRRCGSLYTAALTYTLSTAVSAKTYGGVYGSASEAETFDSTTPGDFNSNPLQRTRLTVGSSSYLGLGDPVGFRCERTASYYTTVSASNAANTLTMTAGDWTAAGFREGDVIEMSAGANAGYKFLINDITGAVATVSPYDATTANDTLLPITAAAADVGTISNQWSVHTVRMIESPTQITVSGWVPASCNSDLYSFHGNVVDIVGGDSAGVEIGLLQGFQVGGAIRSAGLYGAKVKNIVLDAYSVATTAGALGGFHAGLQILGGHFELGQIDLLLVSTSSADGVGGVQIQGVSTFDKRKIEVLAPRAASTDQRPARSLMTGVTVCLGGTTLEPVRRDVDASGNYILTLAQSRAISNATGKNEDIVFSYDPVVELDFDEAESRLMGAVLARVHWRGDPATGDSPTALDTMTVSLAPWMTRDGWTVPQGLSIANPGKKAVVEFIFDYAERNVTYALFAAE